MNKDVSGYAFPITIEHLQQPVTAGMTLRDYFAAKAMQSFLGQEKRYSSDWGMFSSKSYEVADAMMKARQQ